MTPASRGAVNAVQLSAVVLSYAVCGTLGAILMKRGLPKDVSIFPLTLSSVLGFAARCVNASVIIGFLFYAASFAQSLVVMAARPLKEF